MSTNVNTCDECGRERWRSGFDADATCTGTLTIECLTRALAAARRDAHAVAPAPPWAVVEAARKFKIAVERFQDAHPLGDPSPRPIEKIEAANATQDVMSEAEDALFDALDDYEERHPHRAIYHAHGCNNEHSPGDEPTAPATAPAREAAMLGEWVPGVDGTEDRKWSGAPRSSLPDVIVMACPDGMWMVADAREDNPRFVAKGRAPKRTLASARDAADAWIRSEGAKHGIGLPANPDT